MNDEIIAQMLLDPPDPNEPLPGSNRKETIYGGTVPFLVLSWIAVSIRMHVRLRTVREPGWDDFFVLLSATCNTAATIAVLMSVEYGLGHHFLYIGMDNIPKYIVCFYIANSFYVCNTALIKVSLLLQYLRIFKAGIMRRICLYLLALISLWGIAYGFAAWVPCFPVQGYWDIAVDAKCYGYGFASEKTFVSMFQSHTALNMVFDIAVFTTPMVLFTKPDLKRKNLFAMAGLFLCGAVVVLTSVWRLYTIVEHRASTRPYLDFTWWPPMSVVLSCLEIDLAIICASMPIFWPAIEKSLSQIFVTREVQITEHHQRLADDIGGEHGQAYELDHSKSAYGRSGSMRSSGGDSRKGLTREISGGSMDRGPGGENVARHYKSQYILSQVDPLAGDGGPGAAMGPEANVSSEARKPKWNI